LLALNPEYDILVYHGGKIMLAIRISHDIENRLQNLAQKTGRTKTYYAREALLRFIEDMEDEYLALSRLETPTKRWTLDELEQGVDLEH
jgi:RHH-type rel operon transcriptional repressor/antitoxin RelB